MSFFDTHKDLHIKITKEVHTNLRSFLFKKELSMQELFEEFTQLIVAEDRAALRMIENLIVKKMQSKIDKVKNPKPMTELDNDTLYNMLESQSPLSKVDKEDK